MINWKKINLKNKQLYEEYYKKQEIDISDLSFTNLYLWRYARNIAFGIIDELLYVKTTYPGQKPFLFFPLGSLDENNFLSSFSVIKAHFNNNGWPLVFKSLTKKQVKFLNHILPDYFSIDSQREHFDYLYDLQELANLKGRKFHKKKNHLNFFVNNYNYTIECLNKHNLSGVARFARLWLKQKSDGSEKSLMHEYKGIVSVLKNRSELDCKICVLKVDDNIVGFSISEQLNKNTVLVHIEKALVDYRGAYQFLNKVCLHNCWQQLKYVNREEDLGIEGLRKAKLSYHPISLIEKNRAILIQ